MVLSDDVLSGDRGGETETLFLRLGQIVKEMLKWETGRDKESGESEE